MRMKRIATITLLAFVGVSVAWLAAKELRSPAPSPPDGTGEGPRVTTTAPSRAASPGAAAQAEPASTTVVYYFHTNVRCPSCVRIESWTHATLQDRFVDQLDTGEMQWRMVNVDQDDNAHFIGDYGLTTKSVVLVEMRDGEQQRWRNLELVWTKLGNRTDFMNYIADEVSGFLQGG